MALIDQIIGVESGGDPNARNPRSSAGGLVLDEAVQRIQVVQQIARTIGRGASGGLAVAPSATGSRR